MITKERQPLKSSMIRRHVTVRIAKFIKRARSIHCKLGNIFHTDLNRPRSGLKVEGKTALLSVNKCCVLYSPN